MKSKKYKNGEVYKGEMKNGKRQGYGQLVFPDGHAYEGEWGEDLRHGHGRLIWPAENRTFEGNFVNDSIAGNGFAIKLRPTPSPEQFDVDAVAMGMFAGEVLQGGYGAKIDFNKGRIEVGTQWVLGDLMNGWILNDNAEVQCVRIEAGQKTKFYPQHAIEPILQGYNELQQRYKSEQSESARKNDEISKLRQDCQQQQERISFLNLQVSELKTQYDHNIEQIMLHKQEIANLEARIITMQQDFNRKAKEKDEMSNMLMMKQKEMENVIGLVQQQQEAEEQVQQYISQQQTLLAELEKQQTEREEALQKHVDSLTSTLTEKNGEIAKLYEDLKQHNCKSQEKEESLAKEVDSLREQIKSLQGTIEQKDKTIAELQSTKSAPAPSINVVKSTPTVEPKQIDFRSVLKKTREMISETTSTASEKLKNGLTTKGEAPVGELSLGPRILVKKPAVLNSPRGEPQQQPIVDYRSVLRKKSESPPLSTSPTPTSEQTNDKPVT